MMVPPYIIAEAMKGWYTGASMKHHIGKAEINLQTQPRKWCVEQRMRLAKYAHCMNCIRYCHKTDPPNHCIKDSTIDIEEINEGANDEEEERDMEKVWFPAFSPESVRPRISLGKDRTYPRSLGQCIPRWLSE